MASKLIVDRNANAAALNATQYDNNVDSMCGVCEEDVTGSYTIAAADQNKTLQFNHATATAVTLPAIATITGSINTSGWKVTLKNVGAGDATISTTTAIDGSASDIVLKQYESITIQTNDANDGWNIIARETDVSPFSSTQSWAKGANVAAATALPLVSDGNYFDVTDAAGPTAVTSFDSLGVGTWIKLQFVAATTLTHHATDLILPGGANITTAAGDVAEFVEYATGDWRCTNYMDASVAPILLDEDNMSSDSDTAGATQQSIKAYVDGFTHITVGNTHTISGLSTVAITDSNAHGLSGLPDVYSVKLVCTSADVGYAAGDEVDMSGSTGQTSGSSVRGYSVAADGTNTYFSYSGSLMYVANKSTGAQNATATGKWDMKIIPYKVG